MTEWNKMNLLQPDWANEYPTLETLMENVDRSVLKPGWNVDENTTTLICQLSEFNWRIHIWNQPDIREQLKDLLDLNLSIIT